MIDFAHRMPFILFMHAGITSCMKYNKSGYLRTSGSMEWELNKSMYQNTRDIQSYVFDVNEGTYFYSYSREPHRNRVAIRYIDSSAKKYEKRLRAESYKGELIKIPSLAAGKHSDFQEANKQVIEGANCRSYVNLIIKYHPNQDERSTEL